MLEKHLFFVDLLLEHAWGFCGLMLHQQNFMGDTGSLSLGGSLGAVGIITKHEIVLAITGGLFVLRPFQ